MSLNAQRDAFREILASKYGKMFQVVYTPTGVYYLRSGVPLHICVMYRYKTFTVYVDKWLEKPIKFAMVHLVIEFINNHIKEQIENGTIEI